jgi:uncharacterized protein with FMN-binding domain
MQHSTKDHGKEIKATLAVLAVVIILVLAVVLGSKSKSSNMSMSASEVKSSVPANTKFKNGTYMAKGSYESPGGQESVLVSITLSNDDVSAANVTSQTNDAEAMAYQSQFISGYKKYVVGKPLTSIHLSQVSGSSLTSEGFNAAISSIEKQAQA